MTVLCLGVGACAVFAEKGGLVQYFCFKREVEEVGFSEKSR